MAEVSRACLAGSFGRAASDYERGRPGYPVEAVRWLVGGAHKIVDLGAGTGKLTELLIGRSSHVVALEPQHSMAKQLQAKLMGVPVACARAEALPVRTGWADAVVAAQAYHWFDHSRALPEIARVLTARGVLGLIWNVRDESVDWVADLTRITGADNSRDTRFGLQAVPHFTELESTTYRWEQTVDRGALIAHARSRSRVSALDEADRERVTDAVLRMSDTHPDLKDERRFPFPYVAQAFRARKLPVRSET